MAINGLKVLVCIAGNLYEDIITENGTVPEFIWIAITEIISSDSIVAIAAHGIHFRNI